MVVYDLDMLWSGVSPDEADAPLIVDPHAVLPSPVAPSKLQVGCAVERQGRPEPPRCATDSLRCATRWRSAPIRRAKRPWNRASVSRSANERIIGSCVDAERSERQAIITRQLGLQKQVFGPQATEMAMDADDDDSTPRSCRTSSEARTADRIFKVMVWNSFRDLRGRREAVRDAMLGQGMRA